MKFRRKAQSDPAAEGSVPTGAHDDAADDAGPDGDPAGVAGPFDAADLPPLDGVERVDLGSLLLTPEPGRELRLQVEESTGTVQAVLLAGADGALEVRAFAAPRNGDLWSQVRPQIAAEVAQAGGTATEREGPWGTELVCEVGQRTGGTQLTRVIGINGPRWMLRCSLLGAGAARPDEASGWEDSIRRIGVQRGDHAMPVGEPLPVVMPPQARRVEPRS